MKLLWLVLCVWFFGFSELSGQGTAAAVETGPSTKAGNSGSASDSAAPPASGASRADVEAQQRANNAAAGAVVVTERVVSRPPNLLEQAVDSILVRFDVRSDENTPTRFVIAALFLVAALVLRRVVLLVFFGVFEKLASRTKTTLDNKLFAALEAPAGTLIVVIGAIAALKVLKLPEAGDHALQYGSKMLFSLVIFWLLLRAFSLLLDHTQEVARSKNMGIAAFMPWIKKTLITVFIIFGVLMVAQSLGADVKAFLAGLGIGGLAVALAAQDTIANVFGSVVVAIDQPFKIGEAIRVGGHDGTVEDIGLRSTKLRKPDKSLVIIPNKIVAAEAVVNLSRFTQRRVEQTLGLTYDAKADQMEALVEEIRGLILAEAEVDQPSVIVQFTNLGASSLDIWIAFQTLNPDFVKHLQLRQRLNLQFMRVIEARGLSFAFPTQTIQLDGPVARRLVEKPNEQVQPGATP